MAQLLNVFICCVAAFLAAVSDCQQSDTSNSSDTSASKRPLRCGPNEEIRCVKTCPGDRSCRDRFIRYMCIFDPNLCTNRCVCKSGYFRNSIRECITSMQCMQCSKPNQYYSCGGYCDNECSSIKYQNQTNCPVQNIVCNEKCYCDRNYARDSDGNCIPISQCGPSCSDPNEEYVLSNTCPPDLCEALVARYNCDPNEVPERRCRCKSGFLRISEGGRCVPICSCPQMASSAECADQF